MLYTPGGGGVGEPETCSHAACIVFPSVTPSQVTMLYCPSINGAHGGRLRRVRAHDPPKDDSDPMAHVSELFIL